MDKRRSTQDENGILQTERSHLRKENEHLKILYGTGNPGKLNSMRNRLNGLGIEVLGPADIGIQVGEIDETGNDPLENARIKALAYYRAARMPVFSCDSGLYIEGLSQNRQPGVHVRNVDGRRLNDDEMIAYYSSLAKEMGGRMIARYRNAICFVLDDKRIYENTEDDIAERFIMAATPHPQRTKGFPLDSLSIHIATDEYYYDMAGYRSEASSLNEGFRQFLVRALADVHA